jgi:predicted molibdopterin-dependent oxidoreductase YjgC
VGAYLGRDAILRATTLKTQEVRVPEWADPKSGADVVLVQELRGRERDEFEASLVVDPGNGKAYKDVRNIRAKLVARCIVDPDTREPVFTRDDVAALGELSAAALDRVYGAAAKLSGLSDEDVEELAKNSGTAQDGGSVST